MSLPSPHLDDHTFQQIVDEAKQRIGQRCPEWSDHNLSDPGVTLIELFASMIEMMLYRLNRVPDKNYLKFLEMIGISLEPPTPAQTDLWFRLSTVIADIEGGEAHELTLRARETVAATVRTEHEEAVEFGTDVDLLLVRPHLSHILAMPAAEKLDGLPPPDAKPRDFRAWQPPDSSGDASTPAGDQGLGGQAAAEDSPLAGFPIFTYEDPRLGEALYLGFDADVSRNLVELEVDCVRSASNITEFYPSQVWEFWNGADNRWDPLKVERDTTFGFNRPPGETLENGLETGLIELPMPPGLLTAVIDNRRAYWVRCRYTLDLPPRGPEERRPVKYTRSPRFRNIDARVIGGIAPASNCITVTMKDLGQSDGEPGQVFSLGHRPVLHRERQDTVLVGLPGTAPEEWEEWVEVMDFSMSKRDDPHFVIDSFAGEIRFGPNVPQPDGSTRQYGRVPKKGLTVRFSAYQYGGGIRGNVDRGQVRVLKSSISYVSAVTNPNPALGGRDEETLERAKLRGQQRLRLRDRAVTAEDYAALACRADPSVGRAWCVQPKALDKPARKGALPSPGVVRVLLVPALGKHVRVPLPADLEVSDGIRKKVRADLDDCRLLTAQLEVEQPRYLFISTDITLVAEPHADPDQVKQRVREQLENYVHPLWGGPAGTGWPFRRTLTLADLYEQVRRARGVAFLHNLDIFTSEVERDGRLSREQPSKNSNRVRPEEDQLLCTREHRVVVRTLEEVAAEED